MTAKESQFHGVGVGLGCPVCRVSSMLDGGERMGQSGSSSQPWTGADFARIRWPLIGRKSFLLPQGLAWLTQGRLWRTPFPGVVVVAKEIHIIAASWLETTDLSWRSVCWIPTRQDSEPWRSIRLIVGTVVSRYLLLPKNFMLHDKSGGNSGIPRESANTTTPTVTAL